MSIQTLFVLEGAGVLSILTAIVFTTDPRVACVDYSKRAIKKTWDCVWNAAKLLRVLKPLIFIFVFANMPSNSATFTTFN